jgi:hypothetical protein
MADSKLNMWAGTPRHRWKTTTGVAVEPLYRGSPGEYWLGFYAGVCGVRYFSIAGSSERAGWVFGSFPIATADIDAESIEDAVEKAKTWLLLAQASG